MDIYLACGLTHVPREAFSEYVAFIHDLASGISAPDATVRYALRDSDPQLAERPETDRPALCYLWDRRMIEGSDALVAEATFPSTGLGIELQIASAKGIPIVLVYNSSDRYRAPPVCYSNPDHSRHQLQVGDGFISLMALGLPGIFRAIPYSSTDSAILATQEALGELRL